MGTCDYNTLIANKGTDGSIKRWVNSATPDAEEIVRRTQMWFENRVRLRKMMRGPEVIALAEGDSTIDLSNLEFRFLDPVDIYISGYGRVHPIPPEDLNAKRQIDTDTGEPFEGLPTLCTIINETMLFDTKADQAYSALLMYYGPPDRLSSTIQTNLWTDEFELEFEAVATGLAYKFLKDEKRTIDCLGMAETMLLKRERDDDLYLRGVEVAIERG